MRELQGVTYQVAQNEFHLVFIGHYFHRLIYMVNYLHRFIFGGLLQKAAHPHGNFLYIYLACFGNACF